MKLTQILAAMSLLFSMNAFANTASNAGCAKNANKNALSGKSPSESVRSADLIFQKSQPKKQAPAPQGGSSTTT